jgi:hypothetical protein
MRKVFLGGVGWGGVDLDFRSELLTQRSETVL